VIYQKILYTALLDVVIGKAVFFIDHQLWIAIGGVHG
jgi:hypothetical protein